MKRSLKNTIVKPRAIAAPSGSGLTKGDELIRRLRLEFGYDPLKELVELAQGSDATVGERIRIAETVMSYYQPKVKAIDYNPNSGETISLNITFPEKKELSVEELVVN